jgi:N-acetylmuramoyl-L-alanine amidase
LRSASLISRASRTLAARLLPLLVAVDIGHTPAEPGALAASGRPEFEFNRELALDVQGALDAAGFTVRMLDTDAQVEARTKAAAGADLLISIHHDSVKPAFKGEARYFSGFALFVSRENRRAERSLACASAVGAELKGVGFFPSRYHADEVFGEKRPFADAANGVHYYDELALVRGASMPALVIEAGVITNGEEELRLKHPVLRRRFAEALARGVKQCLP